MLENNNGEKPNLFVVSDNDEKQNGLKDIGDSENDQCQKIRPSNNTQSQFEVFKFNENIQIRSIVRDDEIWFIAKEVCKALDIVNVSQACDKLEIDDKAAIYLTDVSGKPNRTLIVNEPGLYELIRSSRKPEAKVFKHWVNHEVLPTIRKTGSYSLNSNSVETRLTTLEQKFDLMFTENNRRFDLIMDDNKTKFNSMIALITTIISNQGNTNAIQAISTYQTQVVTTATLVSQNITHATVSQFLKNRNQKLNYVRYSVLGVSNALSKALLKYPNSCDGKKVTYFGSVKAFPVELLSMYFEANRDAAIAIV